MSAYMMPSDERHTARRTRARSTACPIFGASTTHRYRPRVSRKQKSEFSSPLLFHTVNCTLIARPKGAISAMKSGWNGVSSRSGSARRVSAQASGSVAIPKSQPSTFAVVKSGSPSAYRPATKKVQDGFEYPSTRGPPGVGGQPAAVHQVPRIGERDRRILDVEGLRDAVDQVVSGVEQADQDQARGHVAGDQRVLTTTLLPGWR